MTRKKHETVAVVVTTRNRSALLRRALHSVFEQTRLADEVVIVDDGSHDDTAQVIPHEFPGAHYIEQGHRGVSAARNLGVKSTNSKWIAFLDSDDEWQPEKLEHQLNALRLQRDHAICHTDEIWIRNGRRVNPKDKHAKAGGFIFRQCLPLCVISPSSVIMRRALFEQTGGFDEKLPVCEDYDLWLRICSRHRVLYVDEPLVVKYGGHADQLSRKYWGMDRFRIHALEKILSSDRLQPDDRRATVETLIEKLGIYIQGARKRGKYAETRAFEEKIASYERVRARLNDGRSAGRAVKARP